MNKLERLKVELILLKLECSKVTLDQKNALSTYRTLKNRIDVLEAFIKRLEDAKTFNDEGAAINA